MGSHPSDLIARVDILHKEKLLANEMGVVLALYSTSQLLGGNQTRCPVLVCSLVGIEASTATPEPQGVTVTKSPEYNSNSPGNFDRVRWADLASGVSPPTSAPVSVLRAQSCQVA